MHFITIKRLVRLIPVFAVVAMVVGNARPASAACTGDLIQCYQAAAGVDGWLAQATAALDCDLTFVGCAREAMGGH